jgi:hypothetical protein
VKVLLYPLSPDLLNSAVFGRFPDFVHLPFWLEQHVDEDEYGALVE